MIEQLKPLIMLVSILGAVFVLCKSIRLKYNIGEFENERREEPRFKKSDIFGLLRGFLGIIAMWCIYLYFGGLS